MRIFPEKSVHSIIRFRTQIVQEVFLMITFDYTITDEQGIHARPAGELIKLVKTFTSTVNMEKNGKEADCHKIFSIMGLAVKQGDTVTFSVDGEDEEGAAFAIKEFMEKNL